MPTSLSTATDQKYRWGGLLENPLISKIQRHALDGFNVSLFKKIIEPFEYANLLDVCCGVGEYSAAAKGMYVGIDNSHRHISFAQQKYKDKYFIEGNALCLPFPDRSFDAVLLACAAHHFETGFLLKVLGELKRISRKYIFIDDPVRYTNQGQVSKTLYSWDRGKMFRTMDEISDIVQNNSALEIITSETYRTFPGFYIHGVIVIKVK